jgi:hypothetical protein
MGKTKSNGLVFFVLILSLGGCGLGVYSVFFQPSAVRQVWTVEQDGVFYPGTSYSDMTDMDVYITVKTGETVYVMFNAQISNGPAGGAGWLSGSLRIMNEGVVIPQSERYFIFDSVAGIATGSPITTQFIIEGLDAGTYELKVQISAIAEVGSDRVEDGLLYIHTYK